MDIFKIIGVAIIALIMILILNKTNKEISIVITILASVILLSFVILKLDNVIYMLKELAGKSGINTEYLLLLIKVTGIAYIVELTKNICVDAGSSSLATKVEIAGKVSIVVLTIPLITTVISLILELV